MAVPLSYSLRNIRVRWRLTLLAVVGITLVVAVFTVLMAMSEGFRAALRGSGRADNAMVVTRGSASGPPWPWAWPPASCRPWARTARGSPRC